MKVVRTITDGGRKNEWLERKNGILRYDSHVDTIVLGVLLYLGNYAKGSNSGENSIAFY